MSLLLAPYMNAMRLGQGFNSYTQQICVDDAVVVDPTRAENVLTNDGTTMRILAASAGKPSAWNRLKEVVNDGPLSVEALSSADDADPSADAKRIEDSPAENCSAGSEGATGPQTGKDAPPAEDISDAPADDGFSEAKIEETSEGSIKDDVELNVQDDDNDVESDVQDNDNDADSPVIIDEKELGEGPSSEGPSSAEQKLPVTKKASSLSKADAEPIPVKTDSGKVPVAGKPLNAVKPISGGPAKTTPVSAKPRPRSSSTGNKVSAAPSHTTKAVPASSLVKEIPIRTSKDAPVSGTKSGLPHASNEFELEQARLDRKEKLEMMNLEKERMAEIRAHQRALELDVRAEDLKRQTEDREEQRQIRKEKRDYDAARRAAAQKSIADAVAAKAEPLTLAQLDKIRAQNQFADRFEGMELSDQKYPFDASAARGPSQTVTYSSRFIEKLTDITDDMMISGALTVKMAKIGGSGRGSFVNSDKFKESDLNFYISVKVTSQNSNFKDALIYNPMRSVAIGSDDFNKVYGDSFISGFLEGGEFNAIISMKILNKAKLMDIKAEATVALTAGPVDITANANVGIARTNVEMNTETTIQVSWCGGGHIKPMEQPWNIQSVMQAAARFPQLVADAPQRTYAILTKYDSLRSFVSRRPEAYSPIQYENAQIYTNVLMEAFMSYKSLYKKLGDQLFSIQNKTLEFEPWPNAPGWTSASTEISEVIKQAAAYGNQVATTTAKGQQAVANSPDDVSQFEANVAGISIARKSIRRQMVYIVNEVDLIEKSPKVATDQDHEEPFQSPTLFETRLPAMKVPDALKPRSDPLSGKRIMAKTQTEEELEDERRELDRIENDRPPLYQIDQVVLSDEETASFSEIQRKAPSIGKHLQVSKAIPTLKTLKGSLFNNLEFLSPEWQVEAITIGITKSGCVGSVEVVYENGLILRRGQPAAQLTLKTLSNFQSGERITSAVIETGVKVPAVATIAGTEEEPRVLSVCMYSNHGRRLLGQAIKNELVLPARVNVRKDGTEYKSIQTLYLDSAYSTGTFKGFFGRVSTDENTGGIWRLGLIWGDSATTRYSTTTASPAPIYDVDAASSEILIDSMRAERDEVKKEVHALAMVKEERDQAVAAIEVARVQARKDFEEIKLQVKNYIAASAETGKRIILNGISSSRQSISYKGKEFRVKPSNVPFLTFENGTHFNFQSDGNLIVYSKSGEFMWGMNQCGPGTTYEMAFEGTIDGNFVAYSILSGSQPGQHWESGTRDCKNGSIVLSSEKPYIEIFSGNGIRKWHEGMVYG